MVERGELEWGRGVGEELKGISDVFLVGDRDEGKVTRTKIKTLTHWRWW